jgi:metacaspase-1
MALDDAHALVIGITRYLHLSELGDVQDARDVTTVLSDPACCGYPPAAVRTLIDAAATRAAILAALDELARTTHESSTVFIYYSGHGARVPVGDHSRCYLLPVDATNGSADELERTAISGSELTARLRAIPAGRLTLVIDACRAAGIADLQIADAIEPMAQGPGRAVIAASRSAGAALQLPGERDSAMTACLVEALRGAAPSIDGAILVTELFTYIQQHVATTSFDQHPVFKAEFEINYPIAQFLGGKQSARRVPPPPDQLTYDAFISYCASDPDDAAWVTSTLVPTLENHGLNICLENRNFRFGRMTLDNDDDAIEHSRYTIGVFTPAYLASNAEAFQSEVAQALAVASDTPRMIPVMRKTCNPPLHVRALSAVDCRREAEVAMMLKLLACALREPLTQPARPVPPAPPAPTSA